MFFFNKHRLREYLGVVWIRVVMITRMGAFRVKIAGVFVTRIKLPTCNQAIKTPPYAGRLVSFLTQKLHSRVIVNDYSYQQELQTSAA